VRRYAFNYSKYSLSQLTVPDVPKPEPLTYASYVYQLGDLVAHSDPSSGPLAEQVLSEALKADPANAGAHADLGWLHDLAGRWQDAEAAYQRAVQLGSSDPQIYLLYGSSIIRRLAKTGDRPSNEELVKTRRLFERSAQLDPMSARAWAGIGETYVGSTDPSAPGIASLEKSLALTPGDEEAAFNLVQLYAREGRRADALKLIDRVIAPAGDRDLLARAREALVMADLHDMEALANEGKVKEALVIARAALEKTTNPSLVNHLRSTIASMETWDAADSAANALNDAVAKANGGKYAEALAIVDGLLPSITDPDILEKAKQFRDQVAERAHRGKRK
jgi:tetratricopeptide (TPR) repeat protein